MSRDGGGDVTTDTSPPASGPPVLRATGVAKAYGHVTALRGIDFELDRGEIHALVGDNGAGKSTFIKILSGTERPDSGTIEIDGQPVRFAAPGDAQRCGIETVYQDLAIAESLDAGENVFLGRERLRPGPLGRLGFVDRRAMRRETAAHLRELGIRLPSVGSPCEALSGGQKQAVAVARAAVWGRRILLMDEPAAALGVRQTRQVLDLIRRSRDEKGLSIIFISHNVDQVLAVADRVTVLRLGRVVLDCDRDTATLELLTRAMSGFAMSSESRGHVSTGGE
jgi:simple sugar transport system ATP-binding protein